MDYFSSIKGNSISGVTIIQVLESYISSPLCDLSGPDPFCVCPANGAIMPVGIASNCTAPDPVPPTPTEADYTILIVSLVFGALFAACCLAWYFKAPKPRTYPWFRKRLLNGKELTA